MESLTEKIQKRQQILAKYFRSLEEKKNNAIGSEGNYAAVIDLEQNHFLLIRSGWTDQGFTHKVLLHMDINPETGNIWVQQNNTVILPDVDLADQGIVKGDFVIGFRPEWMRGQAGYAAA